MFNFHFISNHFYIETLQLSIFGCHVCIGFQHINEFLRDIPTYKVGSCLIFIRISFQALRAVPWNLFWIIPDYTLGCDDSRITSHCGPIYLETYFRDSSTWSVHDLICDIWLIKVSKLLPRRVDFHWYVTGAGVGQIIFSNTKKYTKFRPSLKSKNVFMF